MFVQKKMKRFESCHKMKLLNLKATRSFIDRSVLKKYYSTFEFRTQSAFVALQLVDDSFFLIQNRSINNYFHYETSSVSLRAFSCHLYELYNCL